MHVQPFVFLPPMFYDQSSQPPDPVPDTITVDFPTTMDVRIVEHQVAFHEANASAPEYVKD